MNSWSAAIVDASRARRAPGALLVGLCGVGVVVFVAAVAGQKPETNAPTPAAHTRPWFDARLRAFFMAKARQAHLLADADK